MVFEPQTVQLSVLKSILCFCSVLACISGWYCSRRGSMSFSCAIIGLSQPACSKLTMREGCCSSHFPLSFFSGSWKKLPPIWQVNILMIGGKEPGVPERALDLEPEDLGLGWWLVGSWLNDLRLLLHLGTQIL